MQNANPLIFVKQPSEKMKLSGDFEIGHPAASSGEYEEEQMVYKTLANSLSEVYVIKKRKP